MSEPRVRKLAWDCSNCNTENEGPVKLCGNCGAPQPENVQFHRPRGGQNPVTDPKEVEAALAGADIHCGFCGTRNSATSQNCSQCGADLKEGKKRKSGMPAEDFHEYDEAGKLNAPAPISLRRSKQVTAYEASSLQHSVETALKDKTTRTVATVVGSVIVLSLCWFLIWVFFINTTPEEVKITRFYWTTTTEVEKYDWVTKTNQSSSPPSGARNIQESEEITGHGKMESCGPGGTEKQKTGAQYECDEDCKDAGNGYEVCTPVMCDVEVDVAITACSQVDDPSKPTKEPRWSYEIQEWIHDYDESNAGFDQFPVWPSPVIDDSYQRIGTQSQAFTVYYEDAEEKEHQETRVFLWDLEWFQSFHVGQICVANRNIVGILLTGLDCSAAVNP